MDDETLFKKLDFAANGDTADETTEGARILDGRYVVRLEYMGQPPTARIKVMRVKNKERAKSWIVKQAIRALFLSDERWRRALRVELSVEIPHLDTRDRARLIEQVGGLARLAQYAQYMTAFHPRNVVYLAARLSAKGYTPQPVWKGTRPPNASVTPSSADLVAWDDRGAGDRPGPRLRRFPPTLYAADKIPQTAQTVAVLAFPMYERLTSVSELEHRERPMVNAIASLLFSDEALPVGPAPPRFAVGLFLALTGRVFEEAGSDMPPADMDDALCLRVAETLGRLHCRKTPDLLF